MIGEFDLTGLNSNFASQSLEISIAIDIDANGIVTVTAVENASGVQQSFTVDRESGTVMIKKSDVFIHYS